MPTSRLIGRQAELDRLADLALAHPVLTLTGPGGVGKTRLALAFAEHRRDVTGEPIVLGQLATVEPGADPDAVADALGFECLDAACVVLAERSGTVVLDNCEHVVDAARRVADALAAAGALVVATSRAPIGADGEHVVVVPPLAVPPEGGADAERSPAVELFLEHARSVGATLEPSPQLLADVSDLCRRLDGLPLAIELAAARTRGIAPGDLLAEVDQHLGLLSRSPGSGDRHDSMRAAIEVSTALLTPAERTFFRRLGVFTGPFDLGLAHAVAGGGDRLVSLDLLAGLVERSLVTGEADGSAARYHVLELLRAHALEELADAGEVTDVQERFVGAMVRVADDVVAAAMARWDPSLLATASAQYANLVRACELCLERDARPDRAFRLLLPMFAAVHEGRPNEVWHLGQRVLARWPTDPAPWRAEVLAVLATAAAIAGRHDDVAPLAMAVVDDPSAGDVANALADRAWGLAARGDDPKDAARHFLLAQAAAEQAGFASMVLEVQTFAAGELDLAGERERAMASLQDVLERSERSGDVFVTVLAHLVRGRVHLRAGDVEAARRDVAAAEEASARMGQPWWSAALARTRAAVASFGPGGWSAAAPVWRDAVDFAASQGALGELAITLRTAAVVAHQLGEREAASVLLAAAPRSTAITVLPELFPEALAEVTATTSPVGGSLLEALARARRALGASVGGGPGPAAAVPGAVDAHDASDRGPRRPELVAEGETWRITFAGRTVNVGDRKGIGDLAVLFERAGAEVHALELMGGADVGGTAGPALDERARSSYQRRIVELQRDIDEARADHDNGRAERAELELDALVEQLSEAFGIGGRSRTTGSSVERARTAVTYRIRAAIRKVAQVHPELGRHLDNAVHTGTWCSYRPETEMGWTVERRRLTV